MAALDDFKRFIEDAEGGDQYQAWLRDNSGLTAQQKKQKPLPPPTPTSEAGKWYAFRDAVLAGSTETPPAMATYHGRELVDAAVETQHFVALEKSSAVDPTPTPTPPASTGVQKPYGVLRLGTSYSTAGDLSRYGIVCCGVSDVDKEAALPASVKKLVYMDATDIPTWFTGVNRQDVINNKWYLELEGDGSTYLADVGNTAYQQAFVDQCSAFLTAHKLDGYYLDDVITSLDGYYGSAWPSKYPDPQSWYTAMAAFVNNTGKQMKAKGFYVGANAVAYFSGNRGVFPGTNSDDGSAEAVWIKMLAPGLSFVMVEDWMRKNGHMRSTIVSWDNQWDKWQSLVRVAQDVGLDFVPTINVDAGHNSDIVYTQASFLLDKDDNRGGGTLVFGAGDSYSTTWAKPVGNALGPKAKSGNVWTRKFDDGNGGVVTVTVDPVTVTASIV